MMHEITIGYHLTFFLKIGCKEIKGHTSKKSAYLICSAKQISVPGADIEID